MSQSIIINSDDFRALNYLLNDMSIRQNKQKSEKKEKPVYQNLIGLEWEPQLTIPEVGNYPIYVSYTSGKTRLEQAINRLYLNFNTDFFEMDRKRTTLDILSWKMAYHNIEIKTMPIGLSQLQDEINLSNDLLGQFIEKVSKIIKMKIGVFLPVPKVTFQPEYFEGNKHVNISFANASQEQMEYFSYTKPNMSAQDKNWIRIKQEFKFKNYNTSITTKDGDKHDYVPIRIHIHTPYQFTDYNGLYENVCKNFNTDVYKIYEYLDQPFITAPHFVGHTDKKFNWHKIGGLI